MVSCSLSHLSGWPNYNTLSLNYMSTCSFSKVQPANLRNLISVPPTPLHIRPPEPHLASLEIIVPRSLLAGSAPTQTIPPPSLIHPTQQASSNYPSSPLLRDWTFPLPILHGISSIGPPSRQNISSVHAPPTGIEVISFPLPSNDVTLSCQSPFSYTTQGTGMRITFLVIISPSAPRGFRSQYLSPLSTLENKLLRTTFFVPLQ